MRYPLEQMDHFIHNCICPHVLIRIIDNNTYSLQIWNPLSSLNDNIKTHLLQHVRLAKKKKHMRHHLNVAHAACINYIIKLSAYIAAIKALEKITPAHQDVIKNYVLLQNIIYSVVAFIEENFGTYTQFEDSPCLVHPDKLNNCRQRFIRLKQIASTRCNDAVLLDIAFAEWETFFNEPSLPTCKHRKFLYLKKYISYLEKLTLRYNGLNWNNELKNCLCFLNYNHFSFGNYIMEQFRLATRNVRSHDEKIERWRLFHKEFKQLNHHPGLVRFPDSQSLKKLVSNKIKAEIKYLENKQAETRTGPQKETANANENKILTPLSVAQLALFTRLLIDAGILKTDSRSGILRQIAGGISTTKAGSISEESLRIKYYTPQTVAINIIKEYLYKMINLLRNY